MNLETPRAFAATLVVAMTFGFQAAAARAGDAPVCAPEGDQPAFALALQALTDSSGADLALTVTPAASGCTVPDTIKKVQLKTFALDGTLDATRNVTDVSDPGGIATLDLGKLVRGQHVAVEALVQPDQPPRAYVLRGETTVLLRPDLVVASLDAPRQVLRNRAFTVRAQIDERNGDVGATATASLAVGTDVVASTKVVVAAGGRTEVSFPVTLAQIGAADLAVSIAGAVPRESDTSNNSEAARVEVTELELAPQNVLVQSLWGYGGQFNQHVYAALSSPPVTPQNVLEMEGKVVALEPQFVRIFFNLSEFTFPDRMDSFIRTVLLAQRAGATINVTWQGGGFDRLQQNMTRFADVLSDLVRNRGVTNLRWVTLQNDVSSTKITMTQYEQSYRLLDTLLADRGVRGQIRFMGGDLTAVNQRAWFDYMATHMGDVLDAWSVHIAWNYWDTPKIETRLSDLRAIWDAEPPAGRKPLYISEYDVRGLRTFNGAPQIEPGLWEDGTPLAKTNINAFQHAWLTLRSAQYGFMGAAKWDSYFGKYDNGTQAYYMIGSPLEGWPLNPVYYVTRLLTATVRRGWDVVGMNGDPGAKLVTAYAGGNGDLTILGLDTDGASLNAASPTAIRYSIGGLTPATRFHVLYWNHDGGGTLSAGGDVTADDAGVVEVEAPLTSVFALTTVAAAP